MNDQIPGFDEDNLIANQLAEEHQRMLDSELEEASVGKSDDKLQPAREMLNLIARVRSGEPGADEAETPMQAKTLVELCESTAADPDSAQHAISEQNSLGDFRLVRLIGKGGYGLVFLASDTRIDRQVALKVPRPETLLNPEYQRRMLREAKAASALSHPNIVPLYEAGKAGGIWYIASQYIEGYSLSEWIEEQTEAIPAELAAKIVSVLADATQHAHSRNVLHRDLKPANVLIEGDRETKSGLTSQSVEQKLRIADFGLARIDSEDASLTHDNAIIGTPAFMSPEQAEGNNESLDSATDVYSLGAILYTLLTGGPPIQAETILETIEKVRNVEPAPVRHTRVDVARDLEAICLKCLEKNPQQRYPTAWDLHSDLERFLSGRAVVARKITPFIRATRWANRNRTISALLLTVVASLIAVTALWIASDSSRRLAETERDRATLKARQLTDAIDRLFTVVAESPTIKLDQAASLRQELLQQANEIYEDLFSEDQSNDSIRAERAKSVFRLAQLNWLLGNQKRSVELARIAVSETGSLKERDLVPVNELVFWNAFYALRLGDQGDYQAALQQFENGFKLLGIDEWTNGNRFDSIQDSRLQASFLRALTVKIKVLIDAGEFSDADKLTNQVVKICERLPKERLKDPNFRQAKATCLMRQGTVFNEKRQFDRSESVLAEAIRLLQNDVEHRLVELPELVHQFGFCHLQMGIALAQQNRLDEARKYYIDALNYFDLLANNHPRVKKYVLAACSVRYSLAVTELISRNFSKAEQLVLQNTNQFSKLRQEFPDLEAMLVDKLARNFNLLFAIRRRSPEHSFESAKVAINESIKFFRMALKHTTHPDRLNVEVCRALANLAMASIAEDQHREAREQLATANDILADILERHPDWNDLREALAGNHGVMMNSFMDEQDYLSALDHCRRSLEYDDGQDKRLHHNRLVAEIELMIKSGLAEEGVEKWNHYIDKVAFKTEQFVYAAHRLIGVEQDKSLGDLESLSLEELALAALKQAMPEEEGPARERFFENVREYDNLSDIGKRLVD